jgi:uncharacterized protein YndB with AHSA1/START domain
MTKPSYVYVTYIATTPETIWDALTDPGITPSYWVGLSPTATAHANVSEWTPGSRWEHQRMDDARTVDMAGTVLETNRPHRLVISWARPTEVDDQSKHSRVTFDIAQHGDGLVRLTVTHEGLENDPKMLEGISGGWPQILSNLKTLLETGKALR